MSVRNLVVDSAAGLAASAVASAASRGLRRLVPADVPRVRTGHERAAAVLGAVPFGIAFGVGWGLVYGALRRRAPRLGRILGVPFAVPFFAACDGAIAPTLGLAPALRRFPWARGATELGNHVAWTGTAELVHRLADRVIP